MRYAVPEPGTMHIVSGCDVRDADTTAFDVADGLLATALESPVDCAPSVKGAIVMAVSAIAAACMGRSN